MKIVHAASIYKSNNAEENGRNTRAQRTWNMLYSRHAGMFVPSYAANAIRSSADLGDKRILPYLKDVIACAIEDCDRDEDIVLYTNADSFLIQESLNILVPCVTDKKRGYSHRREIDKIPRSWFTQEDLLGRAEKSQGVDAFAFTKRWWLENADEYPDFFIGCEGFDWILKFMMGLDSRIEDFVYHLQHQFPLWSQSRTISPANLYNRRLSVEWVNGRADKDMIKRSWPGFHMYLKDRK